MNKLCEYIFVINAFVNFIINAFVNLKICAENSLWQKT